MSVAIPAKRTVACSTYVAEDFRRAWHSRREIDVVHNGVLSSAAIAPHDTSVREEFGIPDGVPVVVTATRFQRWKGVHVLVQAAAHVVRDRPETCFIIVGGTLFGLEEEYELELHEQIERLGLSRAVRLVGFRSDTMRFFSSAELVVHCSIEPEPFGMVLVEAMASEKAVVASDSGGPREIVENGITGILVPPGDPVGLARAILTLLNDSDLSVRMGQAGAARVRSRFTAERMVGQLEAIYGRMIEDGIPR